MSAATWKREFYPCTPRASFGKLTAIKHSLRKWRGLTKDALRKHRLKVPPITIGGETCSLCVKYRDWNSPSILSRPIADTCRLCPLYAALGGDACDADPEAPYRVYRDTGNPKPMIAVLEKTLEQATKPEAAKKGEQRGQKD